jgi:hypothetical protein
MQQNDIYEMRLLSILKVHLHKNKKLKGEKMKKLEILRISAVALFVMSRSVLGQWGTQGTNIYNTNTGNVGIGTTTPGAKLSVNSNRVVFGGASIVGGYGSSEFAMELQAAGSSGNVYLGLVGAINGSNRNYTYLVNAPAIGYSGILVSTAGTATPIPFTMWVGGSERFRVLTNGNFLIGKTSQTNSNYKLDVNGRVRANEVVVNTSGADFVFEENYPLLSLKEVEQHIKAEKHLPGIPSATEMQENGMGLGEMQNKLLQKIEELTLYVIDLKKENDVLKERINSLEYSTKH